MLLHCLCLLCSLLEIHIHHIWVHFSKSTLFKHPSRQLRYKYDIPIDSGLRLAQTSAQLSLPTVFTARPEKILLDFGWQLNKVHFEIEKKFNKKMHPEPGDFWLKVKSWQNKSWCTNVQSYCGGRAISSTFSQFQLKDCQVHFASQAWFCVLGSLFVDIGWQLDIVNFAAKCTSCSFNSSQF